jgi:hypothetical protein
MYWRIRDLWDPTNLVASTVTELDDILPHFMNVHWDSVRATHGLPVEVFVWKTALGRGRTRPDALIVIAKGGHSWCLCGSRVSCCQVISLARLYWFKSLWHPRIRVMLVRYCHSVEVLFHHVHMRHIVMFNNDYLVVKINDTKNDWLSYYACLA